MTSYAPSEILKTHEVTNQPDQFAGRNLYLMDTPMREAVQREAGDWLHKRLTDLGSKMGSEEYQEHGRLANRHIPELRSFDRFGRRLDEVEFHPAYHELMKVAMDHNIHDLSWTTKEQGAHVSHVAMAALLTHADAGVGCPINMTYAAVPALRTDPAVTQPWLDKILGGAYDAQLRPISQKRGVTVGMAMTEKQGGSDVRANTTRAECIDRTSGTYRLTGHKWFCSAPMSDGFLTLAQAPGGLSCFLVPRITEDGERNAIHVMRLKDKLGNKSNASSEIEYHGATAQLLGEEGRGVKVIIDMVHHTRVGTLAGTVGMMHMALAHAINHVSSRRAFQRTLIDQPAMRGVIADLSLEYEAAVALTMRVARAFSSEDAGEKAFARLAVAVGKFWLTKRNPNFIYECMECHGGAGYVEEAPLARIFRESPLNAIWEGSGNVIALDILRTLARAPLAIEALRAEIELGRGANTDLDRGIDDIFDELAKGEVAEYRARHVAERLALVLQGSLLARHAPQAVADGFIATRLGACRSGIYGDLPRGVDTGTIIARQDLTA
tara:strand:+ start:1017 stop:2672 length:1656 start_codon:yes stop_codon:yes gene_type:complete